MNIQPVYSTFEVLNLTGEVTRDVLTRKVKGVLIECGVAAGSQIAMMQQTQLELGEHRIIYGFDSFEGIPYATEHDAEQPGIGKIDKTKLGALETTGVSSHSVENVLYNFNRYGLPTDNLNLIKGWFEDTVEQHAKSIDKIAFLRLDGDLYRSTKVCMQHLFSKLSKGGVLIIDDYQLSGCAKAVHEFIKPEKVTIKHGVGYYVK